MSQDMFDIIQKRLSRRKFIGTGLATFSVSCSQSALTGKPVDLPQKEGAFLFESLSPKNDEMHHVANGYSGSILLSWGDPLFSTAQGSFDPNHLPAEEQALRFGYNNDYIAFLPLEENRSLLIVNHESTYAQLMFEGEKGYVSQKARNMRMEMNAHGLSVVELVKHDTSWEVQIDSTYNRRITAHTPFDVRGPVAGHTRMKTPEDPVGDSVKGTMHNCSGGITPWGTVLSCEENILYYFGGETSNTDQERSYRRYNIGYSKGYQWYTIDQRFDLSYAPNEPNRFGWVIEVDPKRPTAKPIKRTALGRFYHESANPILNKDGRLVIYMGDDGYFEYLYRYVSDNAYQEGRGAGDLLDKGILSVAKFYSDGRLEWLPLVHGVGPLHQENGFRDQGDVLIDARLAADLLGATPMDRCEDVEPDQRTGRIYVNLTKNPRRGTENRPGTDGVNPRGPNPAGHILEIVPIESDHTASEMNWELLLVAGKEGDYGVIPGSDYFGCPDNACFDHKGRFWVSTDGSEDTVGFSDGLYAVETSRPGRGHAKRFFAAPKGAEITGPCFSPDGKYLFLSVQHPTGLEKEGQTLNWPDFSHLPPRPSIVVVSKDGGGEIA